MRKLLGSLILLLLLGGALMAYAAEWVGCKYLTAGTGISITCPDTVGRGGATITGGATAAGSSGEVQYNNAGAFGGASGLVWTGVADPGLLMIGTNYADVTSGTWKGLAIGGSDVTGAGASLVLNSDQNDSSVPQMVTITSQGTMATPAALSSGDDLFQMLVYGYDTGPARRLSAQILFRVDAAPNSGNVPGRISFLNNNGTASGERVRIASNSVTAFLAGTFSTTSPGLKGGGAGATLAVRTANDAADAPLSAGSIEITAGGSTTISTGVGSVKMSTANAATNTSWIPIKYAGNTYFVPGWTTNAP